MNNTHTHLVHLPSNKPHMNQHSVPMHTTCTKQHVLMLSHATSLLLHALTAPGRRCTPAHFYIALSNTCNKPQLKLCYCMLLVHLHHFVGQ